MSFGSRLRQLRTEKCIKQSQLASYLNMNRCTISKYENGKTSPDEETLVKIADYFNISLDWLFDRSITRNGSADGIFGEARSPYLSDDSFRKIFDEIVSLDKPAVAEVLSFIQFVKTRSAKK